MIWLILSIFAVSGIFVMFKIIDKTSTPLLYALVINYLIAGTVGFIYTQSFNFNEIFNADWFLMGIIIGILFIATFFILGISTRKAGLSVSTVASKMSVVLTIIFSIIAFKEEVSVIKIIAIITAIAAVFLSVFEKKRGGEKTKIIYLFIPFILFLGMGAVDSLVSFSQYTFPDLKDNMISAKFASTAFGCSFIFGLIYSLFKPQKLNNYVRKNTIIYGVILGCINFSSIYFVIRTYNSGILSNSSVIGIVNISCVACSVILGRFIFKEKLSLINYIGVILALITIILLNFA